MFLAGVVSGYVHFDMSLLHYKKIMGWLLKVFHYDNIFLRQLDGVEVKFSTEGNVKVKEDCSPGKPLCEFIAVPSVNLTVIGVLKTV